MKPINLILLLMVFLATNISVAQEIKSKKSWASKSSRAIEFEEIDGEIEDLEDLEDLNVQSSAQEEEEIFEAELVEPKKKKRRKRKKVRRVRKSSKSSPKGKIVRRVYRKKPQRQTVVAKLPPLPKERTSLFHFTPVIGASIFTISGDLLKNSFVNDVENNVGFSGGILAEYRRNRSLFGIETGLLYMQVGASGNDTLDFTTFGGRLDYIFNEYLYVPLNAKLYPLRFNKFEMFLKAGVLGGFLLSSTMEATTINNFQISRDTSSFFKSNDFQGNIGIGGRGYISRDFSIGLEITYHRSLSDISDTATLATLTGGNIQAGAGSDAKNEGFTVNLGLVIDI